MCKQIVVSILLFLCANAAAQDDLSQYNIECSKFGPGCSSYNRMVEKNNGAILPAIKSHAFVCFRSGEDVFILLTHQEPDEARFVQTQTPGLSSQGGMITYRRFKNGVLDESKSFYGGWVKSQFASGNAHAEFIPSTKGPAIFDKTQFSLAYDSPSQANARYFLSIRLSTLEFSDGFEVNEHRGTCEEFKAPAGATPPG